MSLTSCLYGCGARIHSSLLDDSEPALPGLWICDTCAESAGLLEDCEAARLPGDDPWIDLGGEG